GRVWAQLAPDARGDPVRVVRPAVRRAEGDAAIHAARAAQLLQGHARHQAAQAVADEVDASAAHALAQEIPQADRRLLDAGRAAVLVGEDLLVTACAQIRGKRQERATVRQVAVHQHHGALLRAAWSAFRRAPQPERIEQGSSRQREDLAADDLYRGLLSDRAILERRAR